MEAHSRSGIRPLIFKRFQSVPRAWVNSSRAWKEEVNRHQSDPWHTGTAHTKIEGLASGVDFWPRLCVTSEIPFYAFFFFPLWFCEGPELRLHIYGSWGGEGMQGEGRGQAVSQEYFWLTFLFIYFFWKDLSPNISKVKHNPWITSSRNTYIILHNSWNTWCGRIAFLQSNPCGLRLISF